MIRAPAPRVMPRGRVATWTREQIDKFSTPEVRALLENAERLKETEVAEICNQILDSRPRGHPPAQRSARVQGGLRLVSRAKAFAARGATPASRLWSRGAVRADETVVLVLSAEAAEKADGAERYLLWAPNVDASHPWSDTAGGKERLQHCRIALERGAAEGLLMYGKRPPGAATGETGTVRELIDAETVLALRVEKRGEEYWAIVA
jgi:hypothetical protein